MDMLMEGDCVDASAGLYEYRRGSAVDSLVLRFVLSRPTST